jgi:hypothetical protein
MLWPAAAHPTAWPSRDRLDGRRTAEQEHETNAFQIASVTGDCTPAERVLPGASGCGSGTLLLTGALEERDYLASLVRAFHMEGHI